MSALWSSLQAPIVGGRSDQTGDKDTGDKSSERRLRAVPSLPARMARIPFISVLIAVPLGIVAGRSNVFNTMIRPVLDFAQVLPQFVYLVPVLFLFNAGRSAGIVACVVYAVPPGIRLTSLGLREVPVAPREAATSFGATPRQELWKVQLPLALRSVLLGINQTILMVLATVVIAALIGSGGLGLTSLGGMIKQQQNFGPGIAAGLSIVLLAVTLDRVTQAWGDRGSPPVTARS